MSLFCITQVGLFVVVFFYWSLIINFNYPTWIRKGLLFINVGLRFIKSLVYIFKANLKGKPPNDVSRVSFRIGTEAVQRRENTWDGNNLANRFRRQESKANKIYFLKPDFYSTLYVIRNSKFVYLTFSLDLREYINCIIYIYIYTGIW